MNQAEELKTILNGLGDTAIAIAVTLASANIKGVRNTVRFLNPVIRYCQAQLRLDDYSLDLIHPDAVRMVLPDGAKVEVHLPAAVAEFLTAFHRGAFPDLELPAN